MYMDQNLLCRVDQWLRAHRQEIIDDLIGLVRIPSVSVPDEAVPPYGQACRDALAYMFALGERHGYTWRNFDHYVGAIDFTPGNEEIGVWAHLDVVPVPDPAEWDYPPFEGILVEDRYLIGRGVQDNKMAAIGVFHVMNCLRELGVPLRRKYSLYMGTSEETGMEDARYFVAHYPAPALSIVPDTGFPVCCAQRGSMSLSLELPFAPALQLYHSNNPSVTPAEITAQLPDGRTLHANGDSVHVFKAADAHNAVADLLRQLADAFPLRRESLLGMAALLPAWNGESLGIACADELSGALQMAATGLSWADGFLKARVFMILPVSASVEDILHRARQRAEQAGVQVVPLHARPSCCFPADHPVVDVLTRTYNDVMHRNSQPFVMSGGNYAAYLPNAFGFGPGMPGKQFPSHIFRPGHGDYHQCDESEDVEHLLDFMRVYAMSLVALDAMEHLHP